MTGVQDDQPIDLEVWGASAEAAPDEIELGSSSGFWSGRRRVWVVGIALLGAAIGLYAIGASRADNAPPKPNRAAPATTRLLVPGRGQPPTLTGTRCSAQSGKTLQLGVEIVNGSARTTTLLGADAQLPLGGLHLAGIGWGKCGDLSAFDLTPRPLGPGETTWLTTTFDVLVDCPGPLPVQFNVQYSQDGEDAVVYLGGYSDLGDVPYTGCSTGPG
jgi:hypothetical protein